MKKVDGLARRPGEVGTFRDRPHYFDVQPVREETCNLDCFHSEVPFPMMWSMVRFLRKVGAAGRPVKKRHLNLNPSEYNNGVHVIQWMLATNKERGAKRGPWQLTGRGEKFLAGAIEVPAFVVTWENEIVRFEGRPVSVHDLGRDQPEYEDFVADLRARRKLA